MPRRRWVMAPRAGEGKRLTLPLTISVFTPLTLDRHPAAGRLPFGARAPEGGWFGGFRGTADGTGGGRLRPGPGVAPLPDRCRRRGGCLATGREPGAGAAAAAAAAAANSQCRRADTNDRHAVSRHCR